MINPIRPDYLNTPVSPERPSFLYRPAIAGLSPTVSVVTPFFNAGAVFHETARSVLGQSFQRWEWIIVNNGSDQAESLRVLDAYRSADARIRVVDLAANSGPSGARNAGVARARSDFVVFLDADDLLEPTMIEKCLWHLYSHPSDAFVGAYNVGFGAQRYLWTEGFASGAKFLRQNCSVATCMIRRQVHQDVGGFDSGNAEGLEDWDYWLRLASRGHWGGTVPEYLTWYRRRPSHADRWPNWNRTDEFRAALKGRYPALWEGAFPRPQRKDHVPREPMPDRVPFANGLAKKGKRLLLLVPHLELGGADKFNLDLVRLMIRDHGYEVTVAATLSDAAPWASLLTDLTPDVFILSDFLRLSACPLFLRYLIESRHPDVMCIANSALGYQLLPYVRSHAPDLPVVDFVHMEEDYWKSGGYPRLSVDYGEYLDLTVASSQHLRQWMEKAGGSPDRIRVCTTNVDAHEWSRDRFSLPQLRAKWAVTGEWPVILFAGRLCEQKQPRILVRVLDRLRRDGCGFQALVAGDGPDRAEIESFVRDGASDQVRLMGPLPPADVRELMALSDILFLPSKMEGIALVLFEAMSMGVVPVGANVGGQAELVTPDCGILLDPGPDEVTRYAEALRKLLRDPPARGRLARAARERILAGFTLDKMGAAMAGVFEEASRAAARPVRQPIPVAVGDLIARETIEQTHLDAMAGGLWNNLSAKRTECERLAAENAALRSRLSGRLPRVVARLGRDALERWLQAHGFPHCRLRRRA